jgi:hypothetical protein
VVAPMTNETPADVIREQAGPKRSTSSFVTLRDHFAALAMQELLGQMLQSPVEADEQLCARAAYQMADAMLAEREKTK